MQHPTIRYDQSSVGEGRGGSGAGAPAAADHAHPGGRTRHRAVGGHRSQGPATRHRRRSAASIRNTTSEPPRWWSYGGVELGQGAPCGGAPARSPAWSETRSGTRIRAPPEWRHLASAANVQATAHGDSMFAGAPENAPVTGPFPSTTYRGDGHGAGSDTASSRWTVHERHFADDRPQYTHQQHHMIPDDVIRQRLDNDSRAEPSAPSAYASAEAAASVQLHEPGWAAASASKHHLYGSSRSSTKDTSEREKAAFDSNTVRHEGQMRVGPAPSKVEVDVSVADYGVLDLELQLLRGHDTSSTPWGSVEVALATSLARSFTTECLRLPKGTSLVAYVATALCTTPERVRTRFPAWDSGSPLGKQVRRRTSKDCGEDDAAGGQQQPGGSTAKRTSSPPRKESETAVLLEEFLQECRTRRLQQQREAEIRATLHKNVLATGRRRSAAAEAARRKLRAEDDERVAAGMRLKRCRVAQDNSMLPLSPIWSSDAEHASRASLDRAHHWRQRGDDMAARAYPPPFDTWTPQRAHNEAGQRMPAVNKHCEPRKHTLSRSPIVNVRSRRPRKSNIPRKVVTGWAAAPPPRDGGTAAESPTCGAGCPK